MKELTLTVEGMSCQHCKKNIEDALQEIGVKQAEVTLETSKVNVTYDEGEISQQQLEETIEGQGYQVV
ncbi:copper ion binding protein [Amphibacillus cookii]|uniref:copper ion binding protein n=1 Tax=Amphibacillus cookii TaxID=767787 RepID=UPI00195BAF65|nr:copper ion binding protein [Amphibacillus cookii]MBM7541472.1 copper chaperone [Amphibacillus cookii]